MRDSRISDTSVPRKCWSEMLTLSFDLFFDFRRDLHRKTTIKSIILRLKSFLFNESIITYFILDNDESRMPLKVRAKHEHH